MLKFTPEQLWNGKHLKHDKKCICHTSNPKKKCFYNTLLQTNCQQKHRAGLVFVLVLAQFSQTKKVDSKKMGVYFEDFIVVTLVHRKRAFASNVRDFGSVFRKCPRFRCIFWKRRWFPWHRLTHESWDGFAKCMSLIAPAPLPLEEMAHENMGCVAAQRCQYTHFLFARQIPSCNPPCVNIYRSAAWMFFCDALIATRVFCGLYTNVTTTGRVFPKKWLQCKLKQWSHLPSTMQFRSIKNVRKLKQRSSLQSTIQFSSIEHVCKFKNVNMTPPTPPKRTCHVEKRRNCMRDFQPSSINMLNQWWMISG